VVSPTKSGRGVVGWDDVGSGYLYTDWLWIGDFGMGRFHRKFRDVGCGILIHRKSRDWGCGVRDLGRFGTKM